jgi:hypothetical protein
MNPSDTTTGLTPQIPLSPEDDPVLQAIEAHEVRPEDLYPSVTQLAPPLVSTEVKTEAMVTDSPEHTLPQTPVPALVATRPDATVIDDPTQTLGSKMDDAIKNSPALRKPFQFFIHQKVSKKSLTIIFIIIGIILVGIGIYVVSSSPS